MTKTIKMLVPLLALFPGLCGATVVVEVIRDEAQITATSKVPIVGGGSAQQVSSYSGPLLPNYRDVDAVLATAEDDANGDQVLSTASVRIEVIDTGSVSGFSLFAISELIFDPYLPTTPVYFWDTAFDTSEESKGSIRWVFTVSEDTTAQMVFVNKGTEGFVAAKLFNRTTSEFLIDYEQTGYVPGETLSGIALQAGNKYVLEAKVSESSGDDDDEASVDFYFDEPVEYVTEP